jgi:peptidoglycan/xylan/chitin deacetylase (PgdA/CDA1 family)
VDARSDAQAAILLYHRVSSAQWDPWGLAVEPDLFEQQLALLVSSFKPLPLAELVGRLEADEVPPGAVAVTFDDGYRDNLVTGKPLLERYEIPATVFVVSGSVDSDRDFWWDELERLAPQLAARANDDLETVFRGWHGRLQSLTEEERRQTLADLGGEIHGDEPTTMSAEELRRLASGPLVEIGAHTVTHPLLTNLTMDEQLEEMRGSKQALERLLLGPIDGFSYPYGAYDGLAVSATRAAGFAFACTSARTAVGPGTDLAELPRVPVGNCSGAELEARLAELMT